MHILHPSFFIFQLTESAEIRKQKDEKTRMHILPLAFSYFSSLRVLKSLRSMMKKLGATLCVLAFSFFSVEINEPMDEKARMHTVHPSFFIFQLTECAEISELQDEKKS